MDITLFSEALERYENLLVQDKVLVVTGQVSFDDFSGGLKMSAREVMEIADARARYARGIRLSVEKTQITGDFFQRFSEIMQPWRAGVCPVQVCYRKPGVQASLQLGTEWRVTPTDQLLDDLRMLLGKQSVDLMFE